MTQKMLTLLLKRKRRFLMEEEKTKLLDDFNHKCASCGDELKEVEFDHVIPLSSGFAAQDFQCLCAACHMTKTSAESRDFDSPLVSHFSPDVCAAAAAGP